jgi:uncharacterized protein YecA (UPF0149 family)
MFRRKRRWPRCSFACAALLADVSTKGTEADKLIAGAMVGVQAIYRSFAEYRKSETQRLASAKNFRRDAPKVGRNDPSPCGSGGKFKHRCAQMTSLDDWHRS